MATAISRASNNKVGTCPHGLPLGACPICNGMGGGGGVKRDNKPKEMSWNECYAIGQMMKAQKLANKHTQQMFVAQDLTAHLNKMQEQINAMKLAVLNSSLPKPVIKAFTLLADSVLMPMVKAMQTVSNAIRSVANTVVQTLNEIKQKFVEIADKLTAMFGEAKAAIQKKIQEKFKDIKKKIFNLFGIFGADNEEDEEVKKVEEQKRLFELNNAKEALFELFENPENYITDESEKE